MAWDYTAPENPQRGEFKVLPKGKYRAELSAYEFKKSSKDNDMAVLSLTIFHEEKEIKLTDWLVNTEGAAWKTKAFCEATGQTYGLALDFDQCLNKQFTVLLKVDNYINKDGQKAESNKVDTYFPFVKSDAMIYEQGYPIAEDGKSDPADSVPSCELPF